MVTDTAKSLIDWIKLSPRYLLPVCIFCGFVVFAPPRLLSIFGLTGIVSSYRPWFGLAFLLSAALVVSSAVFALYERLKERRLGKTVREYQRHRLHHLTEGEKELLRGFIHNQTRTRNLSMSDGRVGQFEMENIIFRSSSLGQYPDAFAYNIQPWAWEYLNKHPEVLQPASPTENGDV